MNQYFLENFSRIVLGIAEARREVNIAIEQSKYHDSNYKKITDNVDLSDIEKIDKLCNMIHNLSFRIERSNEHLDKLTHELLNETCFQDSLLSFINYAIASYSNGERKRFEDFVTSDTYLHG